MNIRSRSEVSSYRFDDVRIRPDAQIPGHVQDTLEIDYIKTGRGERRIGGEVAPFVAGDLVVVPPGVSHEWRFDPVAVDSAGQVANIAVMVNPAWAKRVARSMPAVASALAPLLRRTAAFSVEGRARLRFVALLQSCLGVPEAVQSIKVVELLVGLAGCDGIRFLRSDAEGAPVPDKLRRLRIFIQCNYMRTIVLTDAARHLGMSRSAFCAWFRRAAGTTFIRHVNDFRIEASCRLLFETSRSVTEIAAAVGFADPAYFNRQFKRRLRLSPRAWRKKMNASEPKVLKCGENMVKSPA